MKAGRELDALIAEKVMGWTRMRWCDYQQDARTTHTYSWHDHHGTMTELAEDDSDYDTPTAAWSPSTEIADAWQVVEKMKEQSNLFPQIGWIRVHGNAFQHRCEIWMNDPQGKKYGWLADVYADTAPLAICLAALKAVGVEVNS